MAAAAAAAAAGEPPSLREWLLNRAGVPEARVEELADALRDAAGAGDVKRIVTLCGVKQPSELAPEGATADGIPLCDFVNPRQL